MAFGNKLQSKCKEDVLAFGAFLSNSHLNCSIKAKITVFF